MTKQKEKAPDGDNARVRFALYTDESTLGQVKQNYKQDGCGCMSEYVTKAIRYYTELPCCPRYHRVHTQGYHERKRQQAGAVAVQAGG